MENDLLFCSKLMFTNGKIVICKYICILFDFIQIFTFVKHIFELVYYFCLLNVFTDYNYSSSLYFKNMIDKSKDINKIVS
jgi:hypothetical protein